MESASHALQLQKPVPQVCGVVVATLVVKVEVTEEEELLDLQLQVFVVRVLHYRPNVPFRRHHFRQLVVVENDQYVAVTVVREPSVLRVLFQD